MAAPHAWLKLYWDPPLQGDLASGGPRSWGGGRGGGGGAATAAGVGAMLWMQPALARPRPAPAIGEDREWRPGTGGIGCTAVGSPNQGQAGPPTQVRKSPLPLHPKMPAPSKLQRCWKKRWVELSRG